MYQDRAHFPAGILTPAADRELTSHPCVTVIKAGHVGVVDVFGRVSATPLRSGIQLVNPFARVIQMSIQTQEIKEHREL